jgi:hypothetical protein
MRKFFQFILYVAAMLALLLVIKAAPLFYPLLNSPFNDSSFDRELWNQSPNTIECIRGAMYEDLEKNHLKTGTPKNEVINLLGKPTPFPWVKKDCIEYQLGFCSGLQMDGDGLVICFNDNEAIKKVYRVQH